MLSGKEERVVMRRWRGHFFSSDHPLQGGGCKSSEWRLGFGDNKKKMVMETPLPFVEISHLF